MNATLKPYLQFRNNTPAFKSATSLQVGEFDVLLAAFRRIIDEFERTHIWNGRIRERRKGKGHNSKVLSSAEDKLFFILYVLKVNPLQDVLAAHFGMTQANASAWIHRLLPRLKEALGECGALPVRTGSEVAASVLAYEGTPEGAAPSLSIDGADRRRQRPKHEPAQSRHYSGKKKTHTDKNIFVVNQHTKRVVFLGATQPGSVHDKKAADEDRIKYPAGSELYKDTGFQGYEPKGIETYQPQKNRESES
jgi:hypothetical protein